jgi:hypothetical protein
MVNMADKELTTFAIIAGGIYTVLYYTMLSTFAIIAASAPGVLLVLLLFFDHQVGALLTNAEQFNLQKGNSYHWDVVVLGIVVFVLGIMGLPPTNGVLPQSPMHVRSLAKITIEEKDEGGHTPFDPKLDLEDEEGADNAGGNSTHDSERGEGSAGGGGSSAVVMVEVYSDVCENRVSPFVQSFLCGAALLGLPVNQ